MGIFDRFRAQPKWKHADPAVRLAAVEEAPLEEQGLLTVLAREDADPRVRRSAIKKVYDPTLLKEAAERDQDAGVREEAASALLDLAVGAFEDSSESESLKALDHLSDPRHLAVVAKTAAAEAVSVAALGRLSDPKIVASVARRAVHASTRLSALARVDETEEVFAVAMKSEHKDVALAALERLSSEEHIRAVAARGAQKAAVRRAKSLVRELDLAAEVARTAEAAAQARAQAEAAARAGVNAERDRVCATLEAAASQNWRAIEAALSSSEAEWTRLATAWAPDETQQARYADLRAKAEGAIDAARQREAAQAAEAEKTTREQAERAAVCERLETLARTVGQASDAAAAADVPAAIERARAEWAGLATPDLGPSAMASLTQRFDRAVAACEREVARARQADARRARLQELVAEAEAVAAQAAQDERTKWRAIKQEWTDLAGARLAGAELAARYEAASATIGRRETEAREEDQKRQREAMERAAAIGDQADAAAASLDTLTLKDGERLLRDVRAAVDGLGAQVRKERPELVERLRQAQATLFPRVSELREADEWVRWANVGIQEDLCSQAEALAQVEDAAEAARQMRELQLKWKQAAAVPRDKAKALWERFKKAGDQVHARAEVHFAAQNAEREANLVRKEALCQQAEALAESSDWIKTAEAIKALQTEWTAIGPVPRGREKATWERFRAACDRFFTRRRDDLNRRKEEWTANLARKEALIQRVEALPGELPWGPAIEQVKQAQAEWKAIGPVRKNKSEELWERFRGACDAFFERYQQRDQALVSANVARREAICADLEALVPPKVEPIEGELPFHSASPEPPEGLRETVWALRGRWQQAPTVMPRDTFVALGTRFNEALAALAAAFPAVFTGAALLDPDVVRQRAEALAERVEKALPAAEDNAADSPSTMMAARLREALAGNAISVAVSEADEKARAAADLVTAAEAEWTALGPLPAEVDSTIGERFRRASARVAAEVEKRRK